MNESKPERFNLTALRRYIGALDPFNDPIDQRKSGKIDPEKPLTLIDYVSTTPMLNIDEIANLIQQSGRGLRRIWNKLRPNTYHK
ncbi:hypothetical protein A3F00_05295 [Candidatus Daviesbacteria bacterium RIFCSPHIGHO2_12_FULL_37_11]|uniref:Uncharacterized protein n=1 Tax=Candidatus Daviesbacteria bacterium RIFCSPHIGHO2_12_FULL_37_11 TaxID=1797777 RepID=A0A1F5KA17_9BACT|nr:MAG: hypothetical protein A2111_01725 [Candidatus Daviesbacteria bacterium GWA1_38_6]OGE17377.1 MAG: hypothetical protein A2769_00855 [Candidatus Daviesbacteria bacterium RIFCSPHIGHO2_01_FULL_37_27]OGE37793.1 MAG: hypothetical protein A3F00_05295 [Candidatus Daviesbacteria bacterium RIFCSPHIGHO2_12_FULL_37_11]